MKLVRALTLVAVTFVTSAWAGEQLTVEALLKNAKTYDGKEVRVVGKVAEYKEKVSKAGNKYVTFKLRGAKETASVYLRNRLQKPCKDGDTVIVTGKFTLEKKVGTVTYKNEIDATAQAGKPDNVRIVTAAKK